MHTDPLSAEGGSLSDQAYRFKISLEPVANAKGQQCYRFNVDNVLLVPTLDTGQGAGVNRFLLSVSQVGGDQLDGPPIYKVARFTARYPLGGIKDPPDGIIPLTPADFVKP